MATPSPDERDPLALLQYALEAMAGQAAPEPDLDELRRLLDDLPVAVRHTTEVEEAKARLHRPAARVLLLDLAYRGRIPKAARGTTLEHYERAVREAHMALRPGTRANAEVALRAAGELRALRSAWQQEALPDAAQKPFTEDGAHPEDFAWIMAGGKRYDLTTRRQREIIEAMYPMWKKGGDGAPVTEAAIAEAIPDMATSRVRVDQRFKDSPLLGTVLRRVKSKEAAWALHLGVPEIDHR